MVVMADAIGDERCDFLQNFIPCEVTICIVYGLKMIYIQDRQGQGGVDQPGAFDFRLQSLFY